MRVGCLIFNRDKIKLGCLKTESTPHHFYSNNSNKRRKVCESLLTLRVSAGVPPIRSRRSQPTNFFISYAMNVALWILEKPSYKNQTQKYNCFLQNPNFNAKNLTYAGKLSNVLISKFLCLSANSGLHIRAALFNS